MLSWDIFVDRLEGWGLLMSAYSTNMSSESLAMQMLMFGFTSMAIHSGACVINDMLDRDLDRAVGKHYSL